MINTISKIKPLPIREKHIISLELLKHLNGKLPDKVKSPEQWITIQDKQTNENLVTGNIVHYTDSLEDKILIIHLFYRGQARYELYNLNEVNIIVRGEVI